MTQEELEFKIKEIRRIERTREWVLSSFMNFVRYFFLVAYKKKYKINFHHLIIAEAMDRVFKGECKRLIINITPRAGKSELLSIMSICYGFALNPQSKFLELSASDDLILRNSRFIRMIMLSKEYTELFPESTLLTGGGAISHWFTTNGGECKFSSTGSQVMGFGAGLTDKNGFNGMLVIDDPIKATEINSAPYVNKANENSEYAATTRVETDDVPIVLIMQRLSKHDTTAHFLEAVSEGWEVVTIPALLDVDYINSLPDDKRKYLDVSISNGEHISFWEFKFPLRKILKIKDKNNFLFSAQYMQEPIMRGGNLIKINKFKYYNELPILRYRILTADTAQKTKERNDYSVFMHWGLGIDNRIYLIDVLRGKWESPQLKRNAVIFWNKSKELDGTSHGQLRAFHIEDKVSGTTLIQELGDIIPVKEYPKGRDKVSEVNDILPWIDNGFYYLRVDAEWLPDYITEHEDFNAEMTHKHDDQVDNTVMGGKILLGGKISVWDSLY